MVKHSNMVSVATTCHLFGASISWDLHNDFPPSDKLLAKSTSHPNFWQFLPCAMVLFRTLNLLEVGSGFGSDRTLLVPVDEIYLLR